MMMMKFCVWLWLDAAYYLLISSQSEDGSFALQFHHWLDTELWTAIVKIKVLVLGLQITTLLPTPILCNWSHTLKQWRQYTTWSVPKPKGYRKQKTRHRCSVLTIGFFDMQMSSCQPTFGWLLFLGSQREESKRKSGCRIRQEPLKEQDGTKHKYSCTKGESKFVAFGCKVQDSSGMFRDCCLSSGLPQAFADFCNAKSILAFPKTIPPYLLLQIWFCAHHEWPWTWMLRVSVCVSEEVDGASHRKCMLEPL